MAATADRKRTAVVVGAGIAGIQAALDLAEMGAKVHLVDQTPTIGGRMPQLDKTFPTNDCSLCILSPKMSECARHHNIILHTLSEVQSVDGRAGDLVCRLTERAKFVDPDKCVACGMCEEKCPVKVEDAFDMGLRQRKAIYRYFLQSIPSHYVIDPAVCLYQTRGTCRLCEKACPAGAIRHDDRDRVVQIECAAVILATGIDPFDPIALGQYGYKRFKNVVTSIEFERMLSASGPLMGHLVCPGTGTEPRRIAFLQCVGSRDVALRREFCSSVCCMYAIKEAVIAQEHIKGLETTIFGMDFRAFGKDFDKYYERAFSQFGVRFVRSRAAELSEVDGGDIRVRYTDDAGRRLTDDFSLAVLSVGLGARRDADQLADRVNVALDKHGFYWTGHLRPLNSSREGVFVCGAASGPKDIPESVMSASASAAQAAALLELRPQRLDAEEGLPVEKNVLGDRPRVGVFVCHCGINIAGVVDVEAVTEAALRLPNVEHAEHLMYCCSQDCLDTIKEKVKEHDLNRVVVAACTPRTHEPLFRETLRQAGLNEYLFEMANIRDQCSWAHMQEPEAATRKAAELVTMAAAKARELDPLQRLSVGITPRALVVGGGLAGMTAALALADAGCEAAIVEKDNELGGNARNLHYTLEGGDPQGLLRRTIRRAKEHRRITIYTRAEIQDIAGYVGNFHTSLHVPGNGQEEFVEIPHGVVIVATGAREHVASEYLFGRSSRVCTQTEFERYLADGQLPVRVLRTVVMIQCVGSREEPRLYCSRVCCGQAVKNARELKESHPSADVFVLYRDVRTYGAKEEYYLRARDAGVVFMRYDLDRKPEVEALDEADPASRLRVRTFDPLLDEEVSIETDLVVLSVGIEPPDGNQVLARLLKVPLNKEGFFLEAHMKLRPVDFATDGIFMCGLAHGPKYIEESLIQAKAAAARALTVLTKEAIEVEGTIAHVNPDRCTGCGACESVCAYGAIEVKKDEQVAEVNEALCKGCGACAASCRSAAVDLSGFSDRQLFSAIGALTPA